MSSSALLGTSPNNARSFKPAIPASGAGSAYADIAKGGYYLVATVDSWFRLAKSGGTVATVPGTTQPAANQMMFLPANTVVPLDVDYDSAQFSVVSDSATTGTLYISGPMNIGRAG